MTTKTGENIQIEFSLEELETIRFHNLIVLRVLEERRHEGFDGTLKLLKRINLLYQIEIKLLIEVTKRNEEESLERIERVKELWSRD
jgi:glycerophosphoryl diester phosphodiesterase